MPSLPTLRSHLVGAVLIIAVGAFCTAGAREARAQADRAEAILGEAVDMVSSGAVRTRPDGEESALVTSLGLAPQIWFDRVDALNLALKPSVTLGGRLRLSGLGGYKTGRREATYGGEVRYDVSRADLFAAYRYGTEKRYDSRLATRFTNSGGVLVGGEDYFDYLGTERVQAGAEAELGFLRKAPVLRHFLGREEAARLRLTLGTARQFSVERTTSYDVLGLDNVQPVNPPIPEGVLRSQKLTLELGQGGGFLGLFTAERRLALSIENGYLDRGSTDLLGSGVFFGDASGADQRFVRFEGAVDYTFDTFFPRRPVPNELRVRLTGGTFAGELPPQRFGIVDASDWFLVVFGSLRTLPRRPYEGEQHAAFFWEHDFRSVPFEKIGLAGLARRGWRVLLHGGHARTWVSSSTRERLEYAPRVPDSFHHEVGLSLSGLLGIVRLDVTQRLDQSGTAFGVGIAQVF